MTTTLVALLAALKALDGGMARAQDRMIRNGSGTGPMPMTTMDGTVQGGTGAGTGPRETVMILGGVAAQPIGAVAVVGVGATAARAATILWQRLRLRLRLQLAQRLRHRWRLTRMIMKIIESFRAIATATEKCDVAA